MELCYNCGTNRIPTTEGRIDLLYERMELKDGKLQVVESRQVDQSQLTADCWLVQFRGLQACVDCDAFNTKGCGGGKTLWAYIVGEQGGPPAAAWAIQTAPDDASAKAIASGNLSDFGFVLKRLWRRYVRAIRDKRQSAQAAAMGGELTEEELSQLKRAVGKAAMVAGHISNTFGGLYEREGKFYILSLNTRTFRLCYAWGDWRHKGDKERRLPWVTETSAGAIRQALSQDYSTRGRTRHLRLYGGYTNAPTDRARQWAVENGYNQVV